MAYSKDNVMELNPKPFKKVNLVQSQGSNFEELSPHSSKVEINPYRKRF